MRPEPAELADDGLPLPPPELWSRWGTTAQHYLESGRRDLGRMLSILEGLQLASDQLGRVMDFGCAEGRVLRAFPRGDDRELWGVDINAERIVWARDHLPTPFRFAVVTTAPHLPFEDGSFDVIYAVSVFTHITDLADAWFLEALRTLRPGGVAYLTIHDEHSVELLLGRYGDRRKHPEMVDLLRQFDAETGSLSRDWVYFSILPEPAAQVFYRADYLVERWTRFADCLAVEREAVDYQTALVFRKRPR